jgi:cell division protein FtsB
MRMNRLVSIKDRMRVAAWPLALMLMLSYFAYHTIEGKRGVRAYFAYGQQLKSLEPQAVETSARRAQLENQMKLLDGKSLDPDMLDEMARRNLGFMAPGEAMVEVPKTDGLTK